MSELLIPIQLRVLRSQFDRDFFDLREVELTNHALIGGAQFGIKLFAGTVQRHSSELIENAFLQHFLELTNPLPEAVH